MQLHFACMVMMWGYVRVLISRSRAAFSVPRSLKLKLEHQFTRSLLFPANSSGPEEKMVSMLDRVADVDIDPSGKFKYILIELSEAGRKKHIVRGYRRCGYHGKVFFSAIKFIMHDYDD